MNKKIKSRKEICGEIDSLFQSPKNKADLIQKIKIYISTITGKELIPEKEIKDIIIRGIEEYDIEHKSNIRLNKSLNKLIPDLKFIKEFIHVDEKFKLIANSASANMDQFAYLKIIINVAVTSNCFKEYRENETLVSVILKNISSVSRTFNKFSNFILENSDVALMLNNYVDSANKKYFLKQIINKIIPLTSVLIFFDKSKDVSRNTQDLYILLDKKYTRQSIQLMIQANLDNIRKGKYTKT